MCDPLSASLAIAGVSAFGSILQGAQANALGQAQQAAADANAAQAQAEGVAQATRSRARLSRVLAAQNAAYGASGLAQSGTALDLTADTATAGALDIADTLYGANTQARAYRYQGKLAAWQGQQDLMGSIFRAGTTFLGTAFDVLPSSGPSSDLGSANAAIGSAYRSTARRNLAYGGYY